MSTLATTPAVPAPPDGPAAWERVPAFHVMLKPRGAVCNQECAYCFYLRKEALFGEGATFRMCDEVLETFTRQYIQAQAAPEVTFAWQGGEPTLMGLGFFRRAVELQEQYRRPGVEIRNAFQTNGVLLDEEWCEFLREHHFLVGLSIDGPRPLHDRYRVDKGGHGTHERVVRSLRLLQRHGVEYNALCVVNRANSAQPLQVYRFLRDEGVEFVQFIPAVARVPEGGVTEWTVRPDAWGAFLIAVFGEWLRRDVGSVFVQAFDAALAAWLGMESPICVHARDCGNALALEHDGGLYSCDHFVDPEHFLGRIAETPLARLVGSPLQRQFGRDKSRTLPGYCRECPVLFACNGGCPKDRFAATPDGEPGLHYLCEGYRRFFTQVDPAMRRLSALLRAGRPASDVMLAPSTHGPRARAGRNDPCPCGSGRKHKHCCLRQAER